ncbi:MAG: hypothetical protein IJD96_06735 [Lachnospiraceae bacterium]|nr:hypothetical protein [Lachnospiraceae bacterium]
MVDLKCPGCGANIQLDDSREVGFCSYCGTKVLIEPNKTQINGIATVENLLLRAEQFYTENDLAKAKEYYNRVLDIDINNVKAIEGLERIRNPKKESVASFVEEIKIKEIEVKQKRDEENSMYEKNMVKEIIGAIKWCCFRSVDRHIVEGIFEYTPNSDYERYGIIGCTEDEISQKIPSCKGYLSWRGALNSNTNLQLLGELLKKEIRSLGFRNFYFKFIQIKNEKDVRFKNDWCGRRKKVSQLTGEISYDVYIRVEW